MTEELSKRIDDVHKRLDDFRADVNQRFAELREDMNQRFAELREDMNQRFAELREDMNQRFAGVDRRFDDLNHRFTTLTWVITVWGGLVTLLITLFGFFR